MVNKKIYQSARLDIILFDTEDVITTSSEMTTTISDIVETTTATIEVW